MKTIAIIMMIMTLAIVIGVVGCTSVNSSDKPTDAIQESNQIVPITDSIPTVIETIEPAQIQTVAPTVIPTVTLTPVVVTTEIPWGVQVTQDEKEGTLLLNRIMAQNDKLHRNTLCRVAMSCSIDDVKESTAIMNAYAEYNAKYSKTMRTPGLRFEGNNHVYEAKLIYINQSPGPDQYDIELMPRIPHVYRMNDTTVYNGHLYPVSLMNEFQ